MLTIAIQTRQVNKWLSRDPLPDAECRLGPNLYEYVINDPLRFYDPLGLWTAGVGFSANFQFGAININFNSSIVIDGEGNVGLSLTGGGGLGAGAKASGGVSFSGSDAKTICDLSGPFANINGGGGFLADAEGNYYTGTSPDGLVPGGGVTIGVGAGGGASGGGSETSILPIGHL
jgi:hypothetical protein